MDPAGPNTLIPHRRDDRFVALFAWYSRRLVRREFNALRLEATSADALLALNQSPRPLLVAMNHSSWWDPLVGLLLARAFLPNRSPIAPMDRAQLARFQFMRRLGLFGIDPDDPASLPVLIRCVADHFATAPSPTVWITPQGEFSDPRNPVRLRPGAAAIAARTEAPGCDVLSIAVEYAFWQHKRPEIFVRAQAVTPDGPSTTDWHRAIQSTMQSNADALAALVSTRDPSPFVSLLGDAAPATNPVYDLWLRLRGRSGKLTTGRERRARLTSTGAAR